MAKKYPPFRSALLFPNNAIAYIYSQIDLQKKILQPIRKALPAPLAKHVMHCIVNQKKLIIFTDAAAWSSQLRFYNSTILAAIAPIIREPITVMQIKIASPNVTRPGSLTPPPIIPSAEKIMLIRNTGLTASDEQLKQALINLSVTLEKLSKPS